MNSKHLRKMPRRGLPVWAVVLIDILAAALILGIFCLGHIVIPAMGRPKAPAPTETPAVTQAPETTPSPTPEATPDPNLTEWQIKFADKFADEPVFTENSYKSPEISIELETVSTGEGKGKITYHVADVYVASPENFTTHTVDGKLEYFSTQDATEMAAAANAILAVSGDFYSYQNTGFLMRNGVLYMDNYAFCDICVLYEDGSMDMLKHGDYENQEVLDKNPTQIWNFGPSLLDENGQAYSDFNVSMSVSYPNPRSAVGYYEPGHYCFIIVDGRQEGYSAGMTLPQLAQVFQELGCKKAYNLDGGGSAVMIFNGEPYSRQSNGADRKLGDILVIREKESK